MNNDFFMNNESMSFMRVDEDGNEVRCDVLFTFECTQNGKNYVVYTDNTVDEEGHTRVYAAIYDPEADDQRLLPIESDEEWELIQRAMEMVQDEVTDQD